MIDVTMIDISELEKAVAHVAAAFEKNPSIADDTELSRVFIEDPVGIMRANDGTVVGAHDGVFAHWAHTIGHAREVRRIAADLLCGRDPRAWAKAPRPRCLSARCPRCGASGLAAFSPSGLGIAACDACGTFWEKGGWRSNWTGTNLAQCRVGWAAFTTMAEAVDHQARCDYPDGIDFDPEGQAGEWTS